MSDEQREAAWEAWRDSGAHRHHGAAKRPFNAGWDAAMAAKAEPVTIDREALEEAADKLSEPSALWHGDRGAQVLVDEARFKFQPLPEWMRALAATYRKTPDGTGESNG